MIDIHTHIIPGIDDGSGNLETSLGMLKIAKSDGINTLIATPHYYNGYFENDFRDVMSKVNSLEEEAIKNKIDIEILPGQEVFLDKHTIGLYKSGVIGTLNNTRYMLIELPMDNLPSYALDVIYELRLLGVVPILAHPERYRYIIEKPSNLNQFIDEGCFFQINSGSVIGIFGNNAMKTAEIIIKNGLASFVASDAHSTGKRCPRLKKSFDKVENYDDKHIKNIMDNVKALIIDKELVPCGTKIQVRKSIVEIIRSRLR